MGYGISGSKAAETPTYKSGDEKLTRALVIEEVKIIEVPRTYEIPVIKNVEQEQVKYVTKDEAQIKYVTSEQETVKYNVKEQETVKYNVKEQETVKYNAKEVNFEKPVLIDKPYERPVVVDKEYVIASIKDMEHVRELLDFIPKVVDEIRKLREEVEKLRSYKVVEKVIEAPIIQWINTPVERIVWKDVVRERVDDNKNK